MPELSAEANRDVFATTRWTVVLASAEGQAPGAPEAPDEVDDELQHLQSMLLANLGGRPLEPDLE